jgi:RNA polymerase primary sigma factor
MKEETTRKATSGKNSGAAAKAAESTAPAKGRDRKEVQQLIELGKSKGHITLDEINEAFPTEAFSADQIDELISILGDEEIEIVEASNQVKVPAKRAAEEDQEKRVVPIPDEDENAVAEDAYAAKSNDPVRMYLRKMGSVSLLTREGEVEIAKRIEDGENKVLNTILRSPIAVQEIIKLGQKVKDNKVRLKDVVRDADDEEGYNEDDVRKRVDRLTEKVKRLQLHIETLEETIEPEKKLSDTKRRQVVDEIEKTRADMCQSLIDLRLNK